MVFDEDDPAWLAACIAAVDSLPEANLPGSILNCSTSASPRSNTSNNTSTAATAHSSGNGRPASCSSFGLPSGEICSETSRGSAASYSTTARDGVEGDPHSLVHPSRTARGASESRAKLGHRRLQGVGINPSDDVRPSEDRSEVDPCWRCGEAMTFRDYGSNNRYYGCSSHPLCKAFRKTRKNGAVVELAAEEKRYDSSHTSSPASDEPHNSDVVRCQLTVRVRGGHNDGAAQAAWRMLRRNGIVPTEQLAIGGGGGARNGGSAHRGANCCKNAGPTVLLELGKRDEVRRLVKQADLAYRDVPRTTYSRLMSSGSGSPASGGISNATVKRLLEPLNVCRALIYTIPVGLQETLLPFQRDGVLYGLRRKGRCLIADEMGTGKTLQALAVMSCYREDWPLLIVAPASMRLMWAEEVEHWYPFLPPGEIHLIRGSKDKLYLKEVNRCLWPRVVVVSYHMLSRLAESLGKVDWKAVIFDESHMISAKLGNESGQAKLTNVCCDVAKRASRVVMLSGTPSLSKPFDLFNQVEALSPGLLGGQAPLYKAKHEFAANYCGGTMRGRRSMDGYSTRVPFVSGSDYPDELHVLLKNEVMIRRLKANVVDQLPPLRRIVVRVTESTGDLKAALESGGFEVSSEGDKEDEVGGGGAWSGRRPGGMSEAHKAGLKKVKSASEWVVDKLDASQETLTKFVVFAHHKSVLDRLQEAFELAASVRQRVDDAEGGFKCLRIDGEVPTAVRARRLSQFNSDPRCRVLVVSITAGGQGLDFTAASNVVFVELPESPSWLRQAEDRLHRRRQEKSVNVYLTVLPAGSHDDTKWLSLSEKLTTQTSVMNGVANAESIDVDRVCHVGEAMDTDGESPRLARDDFDASANVEGSSDGGADGDEGLRDGGDDFADTELDKALKEALMTTPLDPPTHQTSQSPTLLLLRAIADSPAPNPKGTPRGTTIFSQTISMGCKATGLESQRRKGAARTANKGAPLKDSGVAEKAALATPIRRKRPRPSPGSGSAKRGSPNPFSCFRRPSLSPLILPPPSPSRATVGRTLQGVAESAGLSTSERLSVSGKASGEGHNIDLAEDADDDDDVAITPTCRRVRGAPDSSQGGDGSVSSPVLLGLSSEDEHESGVDQAADTTFTQEVSHREVLGGVVEDTQPRGTPLSQEASGEDEEDRNNRGSQKEYGDAHGRQGGGEDVDTDQQLASTLLFLVSPNTGRVHVYRGEEVEIDGDDFEESLDIEERRPRHCRCNFLPEDLDRLFEAARKASLPTSGSSDGDTHEVVAREVLRTLPELIRSAPALRMARTFVKEWRALTSRSRPLLKTPSRPPLAEKIARAKSKLTGSTQRYSATTKPAGDAANGISSNNRVMCLFCEEKPASCQETAVDRRDRFCSVACMEALGSRSSGASLRRLVMERDHGICSQEGCGRDCLALVSRLKAVQDRHKRRDFLAGADPRFRDDRNRTLRERLVRQPIAGNAWNADHVTAVYQGGGECGIDNLRTLCVLCHAEVTREQTTERAAARRISKENTRRSLDEAQGQRRLVSFGGGLTLSQPSQSPGRSLVGEAGREVVGGSQTSAFELDSDSSDGVVLVASSTPDDAAGKNAASDCGRGKNALKHAQRQEVSDRAGGSSGGGADESQAIQSSTEALERLISGEDFALDPLPHAAPKPPPSAGRICAGGPSGDGKCADGSDGGVGSTRKDGLEITFTRVRRVRLPTTGRRSSSTPSTPLSNHGVQSSSAGKRTSSNIWSDILSSDEGAIDGRSED